VVEHLAGGHPTDGGKHGVDLRVGERLVDVRCPVDRPSSETNRERGE
jgi:hypothetical protein